jgi:hypothetical protein
MHHQDFFEPRYAPREEKRQANEALGRSFCKTVTELVTNSDSSGKRKHQVSQASGLVDLMLQVPKGSHLDTSTLKAQLVGKHPARQMTLEVVAARQQGRTSREVILIDQAQGMGADDLKHALEDIGGDRRDLNGMTGRNLFGRGLSDVMRAHLGSVIHTYNGSQLTVATGEWADNGGNGRWKITRDYVDNPQPGDFAKTRLNAASTGTAVRFILRDEKCHIPAAANIVTKLANFFMLRLVAADPNVELNLRQFRGARAPQSDRIVYDFPVGPVIESMSRSFDPGHDAAPLKIDFLLARSDRKLEGPGADRETRENGLLIVDELDAVYELTFVDPDYEKADFLRQIFGVIRINGLRKVLEHHLNVENTSPLRVDREGFNREHDFTKALFDFLAAELRPYYEKERKRLEERDQDKFSKETRRRIDDALKHLNKYFQQITEKTGPGDGVDDDILPLPKEPILFFPAVTRLIVGRPRQVLLLIRNDLVTDGCGVVTGADEGITVVPTNDRIYTKKTARWKQHSSFFCLPFTVSASAVGVQGEVTALVESVEGKDMEAKLKIEAVTDELVIVPPAEMEFRPETSLGSPNRRNNMQLYVNPAALAEGNYVRFTLTKRVGIDLLDPAGVAVTQWDVKLEAAKHQVEGQKVFKVVVPWRGTGWNQHATIEARAKTGPRNMMTVGHMRVDEPNPRDAGFFKDVKYDELDGSHPSQYAAGTITVNTLDPLNRLIFGTGANKDDVKKEFDRRLSEDPAAQQRLASILLEEASFRALQQLRDDNKLHFPDQREVAEVHDQINRYKFTSAVDVHRALVRQS